MLENIYERQDLTTTGIITVTDNLVIRIISGNNIFQGTVRIGFLQSQSLQVKRIIDRELFCQVLQVECIETGLRLPESKIHRTHLQDIVRMTGRETQRLSAIYDIFTQTEGNIGNSVFRLFVTDRIEIQRTGHAGDSRVEMIVVTVADHFLQDDRHLLLIDQVGRGSHISLTVTIKDGSINRLDRIAQQAEHFIFIIQPGNHIGRINPGERLIMRVFQQTGRTDGYRAFHHIEECHQIIDQTGWQTGTEKVFQYRFVIRITQGDRQKFVCLHELIEDIRTDHNGLRNIRVKVLRLQFGITLDHSAHKGQSSTLSSQRTVTDTGKVTVFIETIFLINSHDTGVLHAAVLYDQVEYQLACFIHILIIANIDPLQHFCRRKHGTRIKETGEMVARKVIDQRIVGNLIHFLLQVLQIFDTHNLFLRLRIQDYKVTESETLHDLLTQILRVAFRILIDKRGSQLFGIYFIARLGRFQHKRNDQSGLADILPELISGIGIFHPVVHKAHIRNDTEHIIPVLIENTDSLFISTGQLNLRTTTHTKRLLMTVQRFLRKHLTLFQDEFIQMRQSGRIETDGVFHQQDDLYPNTCRIVGCIHLILDQFDNSQQQLGITQPTEYVIYRTQVFIGNTFGDLFRERREHHDRDIRIMYLYLLCRRKNIAVIHIRHADD